MEIRHLRYFAAVAEDLHFNHAAERLHIAQPALSASIKTLEQSLGITLLERTTRSVALTPEGRIFLERALVALAAFDSARRVGEQLRHGDYGAVSVGGSSQVQLRLSQILRRYRSEFPHTETTSREQGTSQIVEAVANGDIEVGIGIASETRENLTYRTLAHDEMLLVVPIGHPLSGETAIPLTALANENLLLPSDRRAKGSNKAILELCAHAGVTPHVTIGGNDHDKGFESVIAGQGVEFRFADYIAEKNHSQVSVLHFIPETTLPVEIFWREDRVTPHVQRFIEVALAVSERQLTTGDDAQIAA